MQRGGEEGEALIHSFGAIGKGNGGGLGDLAEGLATVEALPDKTPKIIETDLRVRHEPTKMVEDRTQSTGLRSWPLDHDLPVPIGLPGPEPMGNAVQNSVVDELGHVRDRWSGSHTSRIRSIG